MSGLTFMHRVVLNADAPHQWWRIGYHAMINPTDIEGEMTLENSLLMELAPMDGYRGPLQYMVAVHKLTGDSKTLVTYYGSVIQIENWFEAMFGMEITLQYTDDDQLNQMTLAQMRKDALK